MTPSINGLETEFSAIQGKASGQIIPGITPYVPKNWASNIRVLGVRMDEVNPPNPGPGVQICPAPIDQPGAGLSIIPVLDLYPMPLVPKRNGGGGSNKDCWFVLKRSVIDSSPNLRLHFDEGSIPDQRIVHGVIEPGITMGQGEFISALAATADQWICLNK